MTGTLDERPSEGWQRCARGEGPCVARWHAGFTLVELMAALVLMSILTGIAVNAGVNVSTSSKNKQAIAEILVLQTRLDEYAMIRNELPMTLADVGAGDLMDPWGRGYRYLPIRIVEKKGWGGWSGWGEWSGWGGTDKDADAEAETPGPRKDRFLVPLNTLYDLYSAGADGETERSLAGDSSQDDILRANDGAFVGLAREF